MDSLKESPQISTNSTKNSNSSMKSSKNYCNILDYTSPGVDLLKRYIVKLLKKQTDSTFRFDIRMTIQLCDHIKTLKSKSASFKAEYLDFQGFRIRENPLLRFSVGYPPKSSWGDKN